MSTAMNTAMRTAKTTIEAAPGDGFVVVPDASVVPTERLETDLECWSADMSAAEARWLVWLGEYDHRGGWKHWGVQTAGHWVSWRCGISLHAAQEKVRVAKALRDLPRLTAAFCEGRLSFSKVRAVTRVATPHDEDMWLRVATSATAAELERIVAGQRRIDPRDATDAWHQRAVTKRSLGDGRTRIQIDVPDDAAEIVWAAIDLRSEAIIDDTINQTGVDTDVERPRPSAVIAERGGRPALRADAILAITTDAVEAAPDRADRDRNHGLGHLTLVAELDHNPADLTGEPIDLAVTLNGKRMASPVSERWMCDIHTTAIAESADGTCVGETARARTPNRAMRRRLMRRAGGHCEAPGCDASHRLHAHHIVHWSRGGPTEEHNLVMLCEFHHHLVHEGGWSIDGDPADGVQLIRPADNGPTESAPRGEQPASSPNRITDTHRRHGFRPKHDREPAWDRPDHAYISAVIAESRKRLDPTT